MAAMTRGTRGFCTGCGTVLALAAFVGCAQSGQGNRQATRQAAQTSAPASPLDSAAAAAGSVVNAATGAASGAVNGAVSGAAAGGAGAKPAKKRPRIKSNGRGGYDASELQQDAIRRAHALRDRYGVIDRTKPAARPATQPANR